MENWQLQQMQGLTLEEKIIKSRMRIREWYEHYQGDVYISFSGGKDSTVLLDLVRTDYPDVEAVFVDTGLEYPEIREFVKTIDNCHIIRPLKSFKEIIEQEGYPILSKKTSRMLRDLQNPKPTNANSRKLYQYGIKQDGTKSKAFKLADKWQYLIDSDLRFSEKCCDYMKKEPFKRYEKETVKKPFTGVMASDSEMRKASYLGAGCNAFKAGRSAPMGFWLEDDIWEYIKRFNVPYSKIYDMGEKRTGCVFCCFGVHLEPKDNNRFIRMKKSHPKLHKYCMEELGFKKVLDELNIRSE